MFWSLNIPSCCSSLRPARRLRPGSSPPVHMLTDAAGRPRPPWGGDGSDRRRVTFAPDTNQYTITLGERGAEVAARALTDALGVVGR
jgi:hypothetical protein